MMKTAFTEPPPVEPVEPKNRPEAGDADKDKDKEAPKLNF